MQYIQILSLTAREYYQKGQNNDYPVFSICPICKAHSPLEKHGFYQRYAIVVRGQTPYRKLWKLVWKNFRAPFP